MPLRNAKSAEKRIELLESLLNAGIWTYDLQTREISWSAGLYRLLGLDPNAIAPDVQLYESLLHPDDRLSHEEIVARARGGTLAVRRFRIIRPDGRMIWLESRTETQYDREGRLGALHGVVQEVTEHENLRVDYSRIASSNSSMRKITGADFWRADPTGRLLDLSNWMRFTGESADQLKDYDTLSAVHPEDRDRFRQAWESAIRLRDRFELSVRVRRYDGVYQRFENKIVPVLDPDGMILEWHGMSWMTAEPRPSRQERIMLQSAHLRAARAMLNMTGQQLASISGVSFSTIRRAELDTTGVKAESVDRVREAFERQGVYFTLTPAGDVAMTFAAAGSSVAEPT